MLDDEDGLSDEMFMDEFRPPDMEMVDTILGLSLELYNIKQNVVMDGYQQDILAMSSRNLKLLLAMTMSGWTLYNEEGKYAERLKELCSTMYNHIVLNDPSSINVFTDIEVIQEYTNFKANGSDPEKLYEIFNPIIEDNGDG